jgi:16S rRNA G1207 methylase RsmC
MSNSSEIRINRFDLSEDRSLKGWNAADELLVASVLENERDNIAIYHDRFGYLTNHLQQLSPFTISTNRSQEKAINKNLERNNLSTIKFCNSLQKMDSAIDLAIIKIPKSLALFELYLWQIHQNSAKDVKVICSFMTKYFSTGMLKIAEKYFEIVSQSRAVKKARLMEMSGKKNTQFPSLISKIKYNDFQYRQYLGVFSANHIDYATQFFLEHIDLSDMPSTVLDLASGNGVIARELSKQLSEGNIHLMDDSFLAIESGKLNDEDENFTHHYHHEMSIFKDKQFDLIVSNPPFHFEYDINVQIPIQLLKSTYSYLKKGGSLQIVSNKHLNYKTHLEPVFKDVSILAENQKFVLYKCVK